MKVIPDQVVITLGFETKDADVGLAKDRNDQRVRKLIDAAAVWGIPPRDIATEYMSIQPNWDGSKRTYTVRKVAVLTLHDISKFEHVLSSSLQVGANYVHGVDFQTTNLRKYRDQARDMAIKAAREKAVALTDALGQKVGKAHTITEVGGSSWGYWQGWMNYGWDSGPYGWGYGRYGGVNATQNAVAVAGPPSGELSGENTLAPGQIAVQASVQVTFDLE